MINYAGISSYNVSYDRLRRSGEPQKWLALEVLNRTSALLLQNLGVQTPST